MAKKRIGDWYRERTTAVLGGVVGATLCATAALGMGFGAVPPTGTDARGQLYSVPLGQVPRLLVRWSMQEVPLVGRAWQTDRYDLALRGLLLPFQVRAWGLVAITVLGGLGCCIVLWPRGELIRYGMRHVRGRILREGDDAVRLAATYFRREMRRPGNSPGLFLAPGVKIDRMRETEGFLLVGAPGSGKTVYFRFLIEQIRARSSRMVELLHKGVQLERLPALPDKMMVIDVKGDQTERWPDEDFYLFAPHDTGLRTINGKETRIGVAWDIGSDIVGLPAARDFAAKTVKPTNEPVWGEAARAIVTGMIRGLQQEHGTRWGWKEFYDVAVLEAKPLRAYLRKWYPPSAKFVTLSKDNATRTTSSYLANIDTGLFPLVEALASAWGDYPPEARVSLTEWVLNPIPAKRTIILQRSGEVAEISSAWMRAAISRLAQFANSPRLPEDDRRRIWMVLDEMPQVAQEDDGFLQVIEVGRSKGMCAIIGAQVGEQFKEVWSDAEMQSLEAMVRNKLIFRLAASAYADYLAEKVIGSSDWVRTELSYQLGRERSRTRSHRTERELVVMPSYLDERLGAEKGGVHTLFVGGRDVCRFLIPYPKRWKKRREGTVTAPWVADNQFSLRPNDAGEPEEPPTETASAPSARSPLALALQTARPGEGTFGGLGALQILMPSGGTPRPGPAQPRGGSNPTANTDEGDDDDE